MKKYITHVLLLICFFILLFVNLIPSDIDCKSCSTLKEPNYTLETFNTNKDNKWATFRADGNGTFFIHPGQKNATKGTLTFEKQANLILRFSIRSGSKYGSIEFILKKNGQKIANFTTTTKNANQILTTVHPKDTLSITADKHGHAAHDWGNLQIKLQPNLKKYILSKVHNTIVIYKQKIIKFLLLSIIILLFIKFKDLKVFQKFQEQSQSIKIFQIVLFIWIFSIPLKNAIYQASTFLIIILFAIHYFYYKQNTILWNILSTYKKLFTVFLLFIASMTLSTLVGISPDGEFSSIIKYLFRYVVIIFVLFYFYKHSFFSKQWLLTVIFAALFIHALNGMYQYITGVDFILNKVTNQDTYKLTGAVYHHNPFGLLMAIGATMSLILFFDKKNYTIFKYDKVIYLISLFIFLFTLFHSQSRSAWVMFALFSVSYVFLYIKHNGFDKKLIFTVSLLSIGSILLFLVDENLFARLIQLLQGNSSGRTSQIWPFTIEKIMDSPIIGYGIYTYKVLATTYPYNAHDGVHNLTLELLLYTGIIGFTIFTYLIWITLKESFDKDKILYFITFLSFIVLMQFDGSLIDGKVHLNIFTLMLFFIYSFRLDKKSSS